MALMRLAMTLRFCSIASVAMRAISDSGRRAVMRAPSTLIVGPAVATPDVPRPVIAVATRPRARSTSAALARVTCTLLSGRRSALV